MANQISNVNTISLTDYNISQKENVSDFIIPLSVITLGIILFVYSFMIKDKNMAASLTLMVAGTGISVYGLFQCLSQSAKAMYETTGGALKEYHLYFSHYQKETLMSIINVDGIPDCIKPSNTNDGILRLDIVISNDNNFAGIQLMEYKARTFQPVTEMHYHAGSDAERLNDLLLHYNAL